MVVTFTKSITRKRAVLTSKIDKLLIGIGITISINFLVLNVDDCWQQPSTAMYPVVTYAKRCSSLSLCFLLLLQLSLIHFIHLHYRGLNRLYAGIQRLL
jgi:hypothetical protein